MALDSRYVVAPAIQQLFRNKDTGLPLSAGLVFFTEDAQRTIKKEVYQLSGSPPNYTYVPIATVNFPGLGDAVVLNSVGAFDEIIYYFPYDAEGNLDLYYIRVYSFDEVFQFDVEAYPNITASEGVEDVEVNFVSNGQFLAHNNILAEGNLPAGRIRQDITDVAYGGWTFNTQFAAGATDFVFFERFPGYDTNPVNNPRYAVRVETTSSMPVTDKDLRVKFENVNRFSSDTQQYTFGFSAIDNNAGSTQLQLFIIKNFGTGGSPTNEERIPIGNIITTPTYFNHSVVFSFGNNSGKVIGTNDDDFIQLAIQFPVNALYNISLTDVYLLQGNKATEPYPITTNRQDKYRAIAGGLNLPDYNGADIGLPLILTKSGIDYDRSSIGSVLAVSYDTGGTLPGYLRAVGAQYETAGIDATDGIPYSRLQAKYFNSTFMFPIHGTGRDYQIMLYDGVSSYAILSANRSGVLGAAAAGTSPFTITRRIHIGVAGGYAAESFNFTASIFRIMNDEATSVTEATAGTSTFSFALIQSGIAAAAVTPTTDYRPTQHGGKVEITDFGAVAASGLAGGEYFTFTSTVSGTPTSYYVWYTKNGVGVDPAVPGHTGIQVNIETADTAAEVCNKTIIAVSGREASLITFTDGSMVMGGDYFLCDTFTANYYVWYKVDGMGSDPMVPARLGIQVDILGTDTVVQVASKTTIQINSKFYAVPDYRARFFRMLDLGSELDPNVANRFSGIPGYLGDKLGTFELDTHIVHRHPPLSPAIDYADSRPAGAFFGGGADGNASFATGDDGFDETRPRNANIDYYIKY